MQCAMQSIIDKDIHPIVFYNFECCVKVVDMRLVDLECVVFQEKDAV